MVKVISGKNVLFLVVPKNNNILHLPRETHVLRIPAHEQAPLQQPKTTTTSTSFKNN